MIEGRNLRLSKSFYYQVISFSTAQGDILPGVHCTRIAEPKVEYYDLCIFHTLVIQYDGGRGDEFWRESKGERREERLKSSARGVTSFLGAWGRNGSGAVKCMAEAL